MCILRYTLLAFDPGIVKPSLVLTFIFVFGNYLTTFSRSIKDDGSYSYSHDDGPGHDNNWDDGDCTAGYAKSKCVGTILYHAECGEWCSDECMFRDFTAETGGMYFCDISDPFTYIYDADLDGIPEDTGALPVLDANGCYYDNCDDDDDEDDYNHPCLEDCDNQCMSDLSCLEDCPIGVSISKKACKLFVMVISASITLLVGQCDAQRLSL